ncbi:MAG TPA: GNAT family N-acetyltransferase [Caulobacteraceae bacterium]|nr:GNAT family N-acetyltransferase [Caulobacteraceae bacterium]
MFALPAALQARGFALRPETDADLGFLSRLYASTREAELAPFPWSAEQKAAFLAQQFQAQRRHYRDTIDGCAFEVIEHDGEPVGRLYLEPRASHLNLVDIALLPAWRGQGVGAAILEALQDAARAGSRGVIAFVEKTNPALRLYHRLGFAAIADHGVYLEIEWLPEGASRSDCAPSPALDGSSGA